MARTRAIQILEDLGIPYEVRDFEAIDFTAEEVAEKLSLPIEDVYKTLVARGEKSGVVMAIVPAPKNLSLKKLAAAIPDRRTDLVKLGELEKLTGYLKGGCSPLGAKKPYPVYIDNMAFAREKISVSAGLRGVQIIIKPKDLLKAANAVMADITE